jgi:hypothetical protein
MRTDFISPNVTFSSLFLGLSLLSSFTLKTTLLPSTRAPTFDNKAGNSPDVVFNISTIELTLAL